MILSISSLIYIFYLRGKNMSCGIYKITNLINNKIYIGKSVNIEKRFQSHKRAKCNMAIHKAIQKYGINNFTFEILEECEEQQLDNREKYWINYFNSYLGEGYNAAPGGEGASHPVKISNYQLQMIINDLKNSNLSIKELSQKYNVSSTTIHSINNGRSRIINNIQYPIRNLENHPSKQELYKLLQKTQGDINSIANIYNVHYMTVREWCDKYDLPKTRKEYGYIDKQLYHSIPIIQYDKNGNIINEFDSIREAGRILNLNPKAISKALNSKSHHSQGYIWKRKNI